MGHWKIYEVIVETKTPLHIGARKMGMVDLTRRWIPGKNFWGAFTAIGAKNLMQRYQPEVYQELGDFLKKVVIFTPFYAYDPSRKITYLPYYGASYLEYICCVEGQSEMSRLSEYDFDYKYIDSYTSTALDYSTYSAEDQSLHELEFISPNRYFRGYFMVRSDVSLSDCPALVQVVEQCEGLDQTIDQCIEKWTDHLGDQGIGGDRSRGFGRIKINLRPVENPDYLFVNADSITLDDGKSLVNWKWSWDEEVSVTLGNNQESKSFALLPMLVADGNEQLGINLMDVIINDFAGDMEPIVGREWNQNKGAGQRFQDVEFCIGPGATFDIESIEFKIDGFGRVIG